MEKITIKGAEQLTEEEKQITNKLLEEAYSKIQRMLKNDVFLQLIIKEHNKEGQRKRYSLTLDLRSETIHFKAEADDWDFARTLHKIINKVKEEIEHKFHVSEQK